MTYRCSTCGKPLTQAEYEEALRIPEEDHAPTTYIVTEDLSILIPKWLRSQGLPHDSRLLSPAYFRSILERLTQSLSKHCFPDATQVVVEALPNLAVDGALRKERAEDEFWICLDEVYPWFSDERGDDRDHLSITRYIDTDWHELTQRGPRPERPESSSIESQVDACIARFSAFRQRYPSAVLTLVDDGVFTGLTFIDVLDRFAQRGCFVKKLRLGIVNTDSATVGRLERWTCRDDHGNYHSVSVAVSFGKRRLKDWVCERDFFPGVPLGGKVVGELRDGQVQPLRVGANALPVRAQYLQGWGHLAEWASVSSGLRPFTLDVLLLDLELWQRIEAATGKTFVVGDLPTVPHKLLRGDPHLLTKPWLVVLEDVYSNS